MVAIFALPPTNLKLERATLILDEEKRGQWKGVWVLSPLLCWATQQFRAQYLVNSRLNE